MGYLKIVSYMYLLVAVFFIYDGIIRINEGKPPYISFVFAALAVFMFFFRKKYSEKFSKRRNDNK